MNPEASRPRIHFTPREGWINDPLGLSFHDGQYHLFFQFVPGQTVWGPNQRWGHATSPDALHWTERAVALEPGDGDDGIWSGSIVQPEGEPAALFYTAVRLSDVQIGRVRIARADDETWTTWTKGNVVAELPEGVEVVAYRDPYVFHDGSCWRMLIGAGLTDGTATALIYTSDDIAHWTYDGLVATRHRSETDPTWTGAGWECPQLFRIADKWVLTVSVWEPNVTHYEAYAIGTYESGRFTPETWGRLSYGDSYYAGSAFADADGTRGLIYWLRDVEDQAGRWASSLSVPHILHIEGDRLVATPHPSVSAQRTAGPVLDPLGATATSIVSANCDIEWEATLGGTLTSADDAGSPLAALTAGADDLTVSIGEQEWHMPLSDRTLRVLLDGPVIEVFATTGTFAAPLSATSSRVQVSVTGGGRARTYELG